MNCQSKKFMVGDFCVTKAKMQAILTLQMVKSWIVLLFCSSEPWSLAFYGK